MGENEKLDLILEKVSDIDKKVSDIDEKVNDMDKKVSDIDKRLKKVEISLENETNKNIQLIAEGHLSLDRKLDEALKTLQPNTMYHLKVNHLDGEVKKIKEAIQMA